jgi:SpoVK/Ycf46/Vps4 family AAA+-type ATPase
MESRTAVLFFDEIDALGQSRGGSNSSRELPGNSDGCSRRVLAELLIQLNCVNKSTGCNSDNRNTTGLDDESEARSIDSGYEGEDETNSTLGETSLAPPDPEENVRVIVVAATNRPEDCDPALVRRFAVRVLVGLPSQRDRKKILKQYLAGIDHALSKEELSAVAIATDGWSGSDLESLTREAAMAPVRECLRSAALLKRRAPQREQRSGDSSYQVGKGDREDPHEASKQKLLAQFRNLRPVSAQDFESALSFWSCNQQATSSSFGAPGDKQNDALLRGSVHYDSSSDEEA